MAEKEIGQFIAELRKEQKLTQKEFAAQLQIPDQAVSKWETNANTPNLALLPALAALFGVSIDLLFENMGGTKYGGNFFKKFPQPPQKYLERESTGGTPWKNLFLKKQYALR